MNKAVVICVLSIPLLVGCGVPQETYSGTGYALSEVYNPVNEQEMLQVLSRHYERAIDASSAVRSLELSPEVLDLAQMVERSYEKELRVMQGWLRERYEEENSTSLDVLTMSPVENLSPEQVEQQYLQYMRDHLALVGHIVSELEKQEKPNARVRSLLERVERERVSNEETILRYQEKYTLSGSTL